MTRSTSILRSREAGGTLIEVLVALALVTISIVALMRILAVTVTDSGEIGYRTQAIALADAAIAQLWLDRANMAAYVVTDASVSDLPGGTRTLSLAGNVATVTIRWQQPGSLIRHAYTATAIVTGN